MANMAHQPSPRIKDGKPMKCPTCREENKVYFDGAFVECHSCRRHDHRLQSMSRKKWLAILRKWGVELEEKDGM